MDREVDKVIDQDSALLAMGLGDSDDDSFLDYEDEDELDRFASKQSKRKLQQKRKRAAGA